MTLGDAAAFPGKSYGADSAINGGLTKREYMATHLLAALLVDEKLMTDVAVEEAVQLADRLMEKLNG